MSHEFKVGEVAIFWAPGDEHHNKDVLIVDGLRMRAARMPCEEHGHHIHIAPGYRIELEGKTWCVMPDQLRRKPKQDDSRKVGSWDNVPFFHPAKSNAVH